MRSLLMDEYLIDEEWWRGVAGRLIRKRKRKLGLYLFMDDGQLDDLVGRIVAAGMSADGDREKAGDAIEVVVKDFEDSLPMARRMVESRLAGVQGLV